MSRSKYKETSYSSFRCCQRGTQLTVQRALEKFNHVFLSSNMVLLKAPKALQLI